MSCSIDSFISKLSGHSISTALFTDEGVWQFSFFLTTRQECKGDSPYLRADVDFFRFLSAQEASKNSLPQLIKWQ